MAGRISYIDSHTILATTSPRTPEKMIPEIKLLCDNFNGAIWNKETQTAFMELLRNENFFNGEGKNDPSFSARDRINRAPQALGFVILYPRIELTPAGERLLSSQRKEEVFLRQLLKFQLPSAYHSAKRGQEQFNVRPYLELFRLIRHFGSLSFDELMLFGLQITDYHKFDEIVEKVEAFRIAKAENRGRYKQFKADYWEEVVCDLYSDDLAAGNTRTRETDDDSPEEFKEKKKSNMRDYADACVRYLRSTGMVNISHVGHSLSIVEEKKEEVDYFLENMPRDPLFIGDKQGYLDFLTNPRLPVLLTDDKERLLAKFESEFPSIAVKEDKPIEELKDLWDASIDERREKLLGEEIVDIKDGREYDDIKEVFTQLKTRRIYDPALMLEWNVWRAMTMIDGGNIHANLKFDDFGKPLSTAQGNMSDIVCDYGDFDVTVEVTTATGQKQYEMEGEPVMRHLGKHKKSTGKETYCLFIAPQINPTTITHFYALHLMNLDLYGGKLTIIPVDYSIFEKMLDDSFKAAYTPNPEQVRALFLYSNEMARSAAGETEWYDAVKNKALNWLEA